MDRPEIRTSPRYKNRQLLKTHTPASHPLRPGLRDHSLRWPFSMQMQRLSHRGIEVTAKFWPPARRRGQKTGLTQGWEWLRGGTEGRKQAFCLHCWRGKKRTCKSSDSKLSDQWPVGAALAAGAMAGRRRFAVALERWKRKGLRFKWRCPSDYVRLTTSESF